MNSTYRGTSAFLRKILVTGCVGNDVAAAAHVMQEDVARWAPSWDLEAELCKAVYISCTALLVYFKGCGSLATSLLAVMYNDLPCVSLPV